MKKLTLFLVAALFSMLSFAALNPYAYGLSSTLDGTTLTVNYSLNAPATGVSVVILNGAEEVKTVTCNDKISKGSHSVEISTIGLPTNKSLTWKVEVKGAAVTDVECTNDISGTTTKYKFYRPQGVAVDNNPDSEFFGRIYIALPRGGYDHTKGVVVFDPVHNVLSNSGITATGVALADDDTYGMHRIAVNPTNGKVYYAKSESSTAIYELTPDETEILSDGGTAKNVISGMSAITNANSLCFDKNGAMYVLGNANYASATDTYTGKIYKIENGTISEFTKEYYRWASKDNSIVSDDRGGFWVAQQRSNFDACDVLAHINSNGVRDYRINKTTNNTLLPTKTSGSSTNASYRGQVAHYPIDSNNGILAFGGGGKVSIFKVTYAADEVPTLTTWKTISLKSTSWKANIDGLAFDYAGNLIVMSATDERFGHYALPKDNNICSTPCASKYAFELEEVVANVYTLTTNVVGEGTVEGNAGSYVEGTTATLTATPAEHYEFTGWTGDITSTDNPITLTVNADITVTANFVALPLYTITATANDAAMGTITVAGTCYEGENVTLTATANKGYEFVNWTKGEEIVSTENPYTFKVTTDVALVANFQESEPEIIIWELNDGEILVEVPTNEELWEAFKPYYNTFYGEARADQPITAVATFMTKGEKLLTDETSEYKWLGDYLLKVTNEQIADGTLKTYTGITTEVKWRFATQAFFNCSAAKDADYSGNADFTEAGKPENWGAAYQTAHEVVLPTEPVEVDYTLPTPVKSGYTFIGWYNNAEGTGTAMTVLPAGWSGTLYAIWKVQGDGTALENTQVSAKAVKVLRDNQVLIIRDGKTYNMMGQEVK